MANVLPENQCPELLSLKARLMEITKEACLSMSVASMLKLTGLAIYQTSEFRRGGYPAISLERLIVICKKLGHTITITIE